MNTPAYDQIQFRFRDNDGTDETDATWREITNDDDPSQELDTVYRIRFTVEETAGNAGNNEIFQVEFQVDGGGYVNLTVASTDVQAVASNLTNGNNTTQQISSGAFQGGDGQSTDGTPGGPACDFSANDKWECEISYTLDSATLTGGEVIDFRLASMDAYTVANATLTVATASVAYVRENTTGGTTEQVSESAAWAGVFVRGASDAQNITGNQTASALVATRNVDSTEQISESAEDPLLAILRVISSWVGVLERPGHQDLHAHGIEKPQEQFDRPILTMRGVRGNRPLRVSRFTSSARNTDSTEQISDDPERATSSQRLADDDVEISEDSPRVYTGLRAADDSEQVSEDITRILGAIRAIATTLEISESSPRLHTAVREIANSLEVVEALSRIHVGVRDASDMQEISEALTRIYVGVREAVDTLEISEDISRLLGAIRDATDSVEIDEDSARIHAAVREIATNLEVVESLARLHTGVRDASDTQNINDALTRIYVGVRAVAVVLEISDNAEHELTLGGGDAFVRNVDDTQEINEALSRVHAALREIATTLQISEVAPRVHDALRDSSTSEAISETSPRIYAGLRQSSVNVEINDSAAVFMAFVRVISGTVEIQEDLERVQAALREAGETVNLVENMAQAAIYLRESSTTLSISEVVERILTSLSVLIREAVDSVEISDSLTRLAVYVRDLSNSIDIDHETGPNSVYRRRGDDVVEVVTTIDEAASWIRVPLDYGETVGVTEGKWPSRLNFGEPTGEFIDFAWPDGAGTWLTGATIVTDPVVVGDRALKLLVNSAPTATDSMVWLHDTSVDITNFMEMRFAYYKDTDPQGALNIEASLTLTFQDSGSGVMNVTIPRFIMSGGSEDVHREWRDIAIPLADLATVGGNPTIDWSKFRRVTWTLTFVTGGTADIMLYVDYIRFREPNGYAEWYLVDPGKAHVLGRTTADINRSDPIQGMHMREDREQTVATTGGEQPNLGNQIVLGHTKQSDILEASTTDEGDTPTTILESKQDDDIVTFTGPTGDGPTITPIPGGGGGIVESDPHDPSDAEYPEGVTRRPIDPEDSEP